MKRFLLTALLGFWAISLTGCGLTGIEDGQAGVKLSYGNIQQEAVGTGWAWYNPFTTDIEVWNVKTQEMKERAQVPSSEGLISTLDISVLYLVPKDRVVQVRRLIGNNYRDSILEPYVREAIRNVASGYEVKALYSDKGRKEIGEKIQAFLHSKLDDKGIIIQDVLLRDVSLPETFTLSIQQKLKTEQEAMQKEFELKKAVKDAEIEVAKANGVAQANNIIANSITPNYLKYKWIEGMQTNQMQVVYVPTEANLPIMEGARWSQYEKNEKALNER